MKDFAPTLAACALGLTALVTLGTAEAEEALPPPPVVAEAQERSDEDGGEQAPPSEADPVEAEAPETEVEAPETEVDEARRGEGTPAESPTGDGGGTPRGADVTEPAPPRPAATEAATEPAGLDPRAVVRARRLSGAGLVLSVLGGVATAFGAGGIAINLSYGASDGILWTGVALLAVGVSALVTGIVLLVRGRRQARELFGVDSWSDARERLREFGRAAPEPPPGDAEPAAAPPLRQREVEFVLQALRPRVRRCVVGSEPPPALVLDVEVDGAGQITLRDVQPSPPDEVLGCLTRALGDAALRATDRPPIRLQWTFPIEARTEP